MAMWMRCPFIVLTVSKVPLFSSLRAVGVMFEIGKTKDGETQVTRQCGSARGACFGNVSAVSNLIFQLQNQLQENRLERNMFFWSR